MPTAKKRRICIFCGQKRVEDKMKFVGIKHGSYYQAGKEIEGYVCTVPMYGGVSETCEQKYAKDAKYSPYHEPVRTGSSPSK